MTKKFKLRPQAVKDIEDIYKYSVTEWGRARTDQYIFDLEKAFQALADSYKLGRDRSIIRPNLRSFTIASHVIFYKPTDYGIAVIRVLHQSMDESRNLPKR